jgi:hypothetical protein
MQNNRQVMALAWAIFRQTYNPWGTMPFRSIGRQCFAWALREAWRRQREADRVAAIPASVKAEQSARLTRELELLPYREDYRAAQFRRTEITRQLATLATTLSRC